MACSNQRQELSRAAEQTVNFLTTEKHLFESVRVIREGRVMEETVASRPEREFQRMSLES